jgi:hypothetical protein
MLVPRRFLLALGLIHAACNLGAPDAAELSARAQRHTTALAAIADKLPPDAVEAKACPDGLDPVNINYPVLWEALGRSRPKGIEQALLSSFSTPTKVGSPRWNRLTKAAKGEYTAVHELELLDGAKHIRVAVVTERGDGSLLADQFRPGYVKAWLLTYDYGTAELVCAREVAATNSEYVQQGYNTEATRASLRKDLDDNLDRAVSAVLHGD